MRDLPPDTFFSGVYGMNISLFLGQHPVEGTLMRLRGGTQSVEGAWAHNGNIHTPRRILRKLLTCRTSDHITTLEAHYLFFKKIQTDPESPSQLCNLGRRGSLNCRDSKHHLWVDCGEKPESTGFSTHSRVMVSERFPIRPYVFEGACICMCVCTCVCHERYNEGCIV